MTTFDQLIVPSPVVSSLLKLVEQEETALNALSEAVESGNEAESLKAARHLVELRKRSTAVIAKND
jgi:hypothetical protein